MGIVALSSWTDITELDIKGNKALSEKRIMFSLNKSRVTTLKLFEDKSYKFGLYTFRV